MGHMHVTEWHHGCRSVQTHSRVVVLDLHVLSTTLIAVNALRCVLLRWRLVTRLHLVQASTYGKRPDNVFRSSRRDALAIVSIEFVRCHV